MAAGRAAPLVILSPKSLLRLPASFSGIDALTEGGFREVIADGGPSAGARRVVLCGGKVYYDLLAAREKSKADVAIVRLEQLAPFPREALAAALGQFPGANDFVWLQEEPRNMGAWRHVSERFGDTEAGAGPGIRYIGRPPSPSPATGSAGIFHEEQVRIVEEALG